MVKISLITPICLRTLQLYLMDIILAMRIPDHGGHRTISEVFFVDIRIGYLERLDPHVFLIYCKTFRCGFNRELRICIPVSNFPQIRLTLV